MKYRKCDRFPRLEWIFTSLRKYKRTEAQKDGGHPSARSYVVGSGWWCAGNALDTRQKFFGDDSIREVRFFDEWLSSVLRCSKPYRILVVDSNSPVKPPHPSTEGVTWIELPENAGHSTNHTGHLSGFSRGVVLGMQYAYSCDAEFFVYVEQDCLLFGKSAIEAALEYQSKKKKLASFGSGVGTPQPIQQSLMIFHRDIIPAFIFRLQKIPLPDRDLAPEYKFLFSMSPFWRIIPYRGLIWVRDLIGPRYYDLALRSIAALLSFHHARIPFGYGRARPINHEDSMYYFQHGTKEDLSAYRDALCKGE